MLKNRIFYKCDGKWSKKIEALLIFRLSQRVTIQIDIRLAGITTHFKQGYILFVYAQT